MRALARAVDKAEQLLLALLLQQELQTVPPRGVEQALHHRLLRRPHIAVVIGVTEAQNLDHLIAGPFQEPAVVRPQRRLEREGPGAGPFHWPTEPEALPLGCAERAPKPSIAENTVSGPTVPHLERRLEAELLEHADPIRRGTLHLLELCLVIGGKDPHLRPVAIPIGRPVHLLELGVVAQVLADDAAREEELQLLPLG